MLSIQVLFKSKKCCFGSSAVTAPLCPPGDADRSPGPGWTSEHDGEWTSLKEREGKKTKRGDRRGNRPQPGSSPPLTSGQTEALTWTDCHPAEGSEEEEEPRAGVRGQDSHEGLFSFLSVARDDKKHHDCLDQETDFTPERRTDGDETEVHRHARRRTNKLSFVFRSAHLDLFCFSTRTTRLTLLQQQCRWKHDSWSSFTKSERSKNGRLGSTSS